MLGSHKFFTLITAAAILLAPSFAFAETARTYEGCFERSFDGTTAIVFVKHPTCTITLTNADLTAATFNIQVINIDPHYYEILDAAQQQVTTTRGESSMTFAATVNAASTTTYTAQLWEDTTQKTDFWFAAISDTQTRNGNEVPNAIAVDLFDQLEVLSPPFVTNSGDIIGGSSDENEHAFQMELYDEMFQEFTGSHFPIPGDHDVRQPIADYYEPYFGETPYTFVYGDTRFIGINSVETLATEGVLSEETFTWLEETLAAATEEHIILGMQHPIIPPSWSQSNGLIQEEQRAELSQLLTQYGVDLVIVGDAHGYDYMQIDSEDFPGLTGSFHQLDAAGAGGEYFTYANGDHFFTLVHVTPEGISHVKMDWSTVDIELSYTTANDGTTDAVSFNVQNGGTMDLPYMRARVALTGTTSEQLYAVTSRGEVLPVVSEIVEGVRRGYVEIEQVGPDETITVEVKELRTALKGIKNTVATDGLITVVTPQIINKQTELGVTAADHTAKITIEEWNTEKENRSWRARIKKGDEITYEVSGLRASWPHQLFINEKLKNRVMSDANGVATFTVKNNKTNALHQLTPDQQLAPSQIGVLPASGGGPQLQLFSDKGKLLRSTFVYSSSLIHGFESRWINVDDDPGLELITVPEAGAVSSVKLFDDNGTHLTTIYPFGNGFRGGLTIQVGDVDGDGKQDCIVAPLSQQRPIVYIYSYNATAGEFDIIDLFEVYDRDYKDGLSITTGDVDGDEDDELLIGSRTGNQDLQLYDFSRETMQASVTTTRALPTAYSDGNGVTLASGDLDFNGTDEFVIGSLNGSAAITLLRSTAKKDALQVVAQAKVFSEEYHGGVQLMTGNIDSNLSNEVLVISKNTTEKVLTSALRLQNNRLKKVAQIRSFRQNTTMQAALVDSNRDQRMELVIGPSSGAGKVRVYRFAKSKWKKQKSFQPYQASFEGGFHFTF